MSQGNPESFETPDAELDLALDRRSGDDRRELPLPAPTNLVVPPHHYQDDNTIVIGVDPSQSSTTSGTGAA